uniref:Large ribosomal subunit protein uL16c n=1 Tax=Didymoplexis pallens TaxID=2848458 RepID=A0A976YHE6_9ASPA|nr:ribosomal protein L16 [Didymoplexis pallens]YP_010471669.1 ribosomal protein L16 [Didymoplexis pallens]UVG41013.1 ribosomal protein L16 [Didymoplexis pallens]UVG41026.1 ribosomal protein L16 [Didymoplexis pallens]
MLSPKRTRFRKQHRGRMKGLANRGTNIRFGRYAIQTLEPAWVTDRQLEAGLRAMTQRFRRDTRIWVLIFPDKPVTIKPAETRMGSGKGDPKYWVSVVKPGRILYEISEVSENEAKIAISIAACKMPMKTKFLFITN